jgi:hypothetical protein
VGQIDETGRTTGAGRTRIDTKCESYDEWRYDLMVMTSGAPTSTCQIAGDLLARPNACASMCGEAGTSCYFVDATQKPIGITKAADGSSTCTMPPAQLYCRKSQPRPFGSPGCAVEGRRPEGLEQTGVAAFASVGNYFACAAHLEAAAVIAFERLTDELAVLGAPDAILRRTKRAEDEERTHVAIMSALARRFGAEPLPARAEPAAERGVFDIARENVVEGVVRETFGAVLALWRCANAKDPSVRAELRSLAEDEVRHAELSWDLHAWLLERLSPSERADIERDARAAIAELCVSVEATADDSLVDMGIVPRPDEALVMLGALREQAWLPALAS